MKTIALLCGEALLAACLAAAAVDRTVSQTIPLGAVEGRIDHMALDAEGRRLFMAALGNNTLEVIDLRQGKVTGRIEKLAEPQGVAFLPDLKRLVVANGAGNAVHFYDSESLKRLKTIDGLEDADNVRYDPRAGRVYVGCSKGNDGAIVALDARTMEKVQAVLVGGHPESFQLTGDGSRIFVNVPDAHHVAVIDAKRGEVAARWNVPERSANFPMALDEAHQRLFIGCRRPAQLLVLDTTSGRTVTSIEISGDTDDLFYDARKREIYASCGEGFVDILEQTDPDHYRRMLKIPTAAGARTSYFAAPLQTLFVAVPHRGAQAAELRAFRMD